MMSLYALFGYVLVLLCGNSVNSSGDIIMTSSGLS